MPERSTSFVIGDSLYKRVNLAAAHGMSSSEFIRAACEAALDELAKHDPALRAHFAFLAERWQVPA
jgi:hypothetical protein